MQNIVKVWVWVIVKKDNKYLLWLRKWNHWWWTWWFPWGHLEFNENFEECAIRETLEETNLEIENIKFLTATNDIFHDTNKHFVTIFMTCDYKNWTLKTMEPDKFEKWEWFKKNNFPKNVMMPDNIVYNNLIKY